MALTPEQKAQAPGQLRQIAGYVPEIRVRHGGRQATHGRCPLARVRHFGLKVGDDHPVIWGCADADPSCRCPVEAVTELLINEYGVPAELLGSYAAKLLRTGQPKQAVHVPSPDWRSECVQLRQENDRLRSGIQAVIDQPDRASRLLRFRLLLLLENKDIGDLTREDIRDLAERARCKPTQIKELANQFAPVSKG